MSSPTADAGAEDAVAVADTGGGKAPRRFPPPCWTQEETLALIDAYRDRWYSLRRGYLRTPDWDAVAAAVANRCPGASPQKTSAQCRHKMEKLRQRFRAEKQRALSFSHPAGRYFSSWFFFENMEAMENGTTPPTHARNPGDLADGSRFPILDQNIVKLTLKAGNGADAAPDSGFDHSFAKSKRFNAASNSPGDYSLYLNKEAFDNEGPPVNGIPQPQLKSKPKKSGNKIFRNFDEISAGIHQADMLPPRLMMKNFEKFNSNDSKTTPSHEFWVKFPAPAPAAATNTNNYPSAPKFRSPNYYADINPTVDSGLKRGRNGVEEIVASIKMLGEGFMKMEIAKMEMAREMEAMRMEMEMKRNQMLLESQKQIVDAFLKGLLELKKSKKVKTGVAADPSGQP